MEEGDMNLDEELGTATSSLLETYELMTKYGSEDSKDADSVLKIMEQFCEINHEENRHKEALKDALTAKTVSDFEKIYDESLKKNNKKCYPKKTSDYKEFERRVKETINIAAVQSATSSKGTTAVQSHRVECDEYVMESNISIIDIFTKLPMTDPLRNKICGHHYEKSSILEHMSNNPRLRCPLYGCVNNKFLEREDLMEDAEFKSKIEQMVANMNSQASLGVDE